MGFVGPLDRQLLTFAWKITAVRRSLRDLLETVLTSMFLNGDVDRERDDWKDIVHGSVTKLMYLAYADIISRLPFAGDNGSGLGIAVKTYLDAVSDDVEVTEAVKTSVKHQEGKYNWFQQLRGNGHLTKSLDQAWNLWDAVGRPSRDRW